MRKNKLDLETIGTLCVGRSDTTARLLVALSTFFLMTASASAVTFTPSSQATLDFGNVTLGDTLVIQYHAGWSLSPGEQNPGISSLAEDSIDPVWKAFVIYPLGTYDCKSGGACSSTTFWNISFTPNVLGISSRAEILFFYYPEGTNQWVTFGVNLVGNGISATPLPAALPLFATGLGALGLLSWRRKRKQVG